MERPSSDAIAQAAATLAASFNDRRANGFNSPEMVDQFHFFFNRLSNDFQKQQKDQS